ncbi:MAG: hypothetical protein U0840_15835 [Gemmataceae bacterium]
MKAEERKALETNVLADELGKAIRGLKKGPPLALLLYSGLAVLLLLGFFLFRYFWSSSGAAISERWVQVDSIVFPEQIEEYLKESDLKGTPQAGVVGFKEARLKLTQGIRDLGANFPQAKKNLEEGTELYEKLLTSKLTTQSSLLHQEALWGAAKGSESLGDLDKATGFYSKLAKEYPASAMGKDAARQLARLESSEGRKDLAELRQLFSAPK